MSAESPWWVYIIRARSGKLYTGITTDVARRLGEHDAGGLKGARFFRGDPPQALVYREAAANRSAASRREAAIKALPRDAKLALIAGAPDLKVNGGDRGG